MLAIAHDCYGPPETLRLVDRERPRLRRPTDVLLRVHAASLHMADSFIVRGSPGLGRLGFGLMRPRQPIVGQACAGRADERHLALLPLDLDPIEAAALPTAGLATLGKARFQALTRHALARTSRSTTSARSANLPGRPTVRPACYAPPSCCA